VCGDAIKRGPPLPPPAGGGPCGRGLTPHPRGGRRGGGGGARGGGGGGGVRDRGWEDPAPGVRLLCRTRSTVVLRFNGLFAR